MYPVPAVPPVTTIGEDEPVFVCPPDEVTVYEVIVDPPVAGAVNATEACGEDPYDIPVTFVAVGADIVAGTVVAVIAADAEDAADVPYTLDEVTVNV